MKNKSKKNESKRQYVICRCHDAGVHAGYLVTQDGRKATLYESRRLWRWWSIFSLSELAKFGLRTDKISECKFGTTLDEITLLDVCEIIPCTNAARESIRGVKDANT